MPVFVIELVVLFLVLWLFVLRPGAKRAKAVRSEQAAAAVGSEVMLTSGIFGTIALIDEDAAKIGVEIAPGVVIHVARAAIANVTPPKTEEELEAGDGAEASEPADEAVETD